VLVLRGLKSDEMLTRSFGFPTVRYKVAAFAVAGAYAAIAGVLYAYFIQYVSPEPFTFFSASFQAFVVLAIGGPGLLWGPVLGAALLTGLPEILQLDPQVKLIVYGFVLLAVIVLLPRGLAAGMTDAFRFAATRLRRAG
jgi:branched-chain amino acid transport system permease protein